MSQPISPSHDGSVPAGALAIVNARVWTGDRRRPWADAVLIRGETLEMVGSSAEVKKRVTGDVRTLDAAGMLLVPGFRDGASAPLARIHAAVVRRAPAGDETTDIGVLAAGASADLMLVDGDITRMAPADIESARVMLTMVGGRVAYDPDGLLR